MASDPASADTGKTTVERLAHYREQAAQFRQWATEETGPEARHGLLDMARQYERLARELEVRIGGARQSAGERPTP
jgi:catalase (peroxidase I)